MKRVLFIISHIGSGTDVLFNTLADNPRIQGCRLPLVYTGYPAIESLTKQPHKYETSASIWMEELLFNFSLASKDLYELCSFVFLVREAEPSLNETLKTDWLPFQYSQRGAMYYYKYRLRRICEIAKRTPGAVLLTWEDLVSGKGLPLMEEYLNLKTPLKLKGRDWDSKNIVETKYVEEAQRSYERHLWFLRQLNLVKV